MVGTAALAIVTVVEVVARPRVLPLVVVARERLLVADARDLEVVIVVTSGRVVLVVVARDVVVKACALLATGFAAALVRVGATRWAERGALALLLSVDGLLSRVRAFGAKTFTVAPDVLPAARKLPRTASATATRTPPASARRRLTGMAQ